MRRVTNATSARPIATSHPHARMKLDDAINATVRNGSFCRVWANTPTICGTTYTSSAVTTSTATVVTIAG